VFRLIQLLMKIVGDRKWFAKNGFQIPQIIRPASLPASQPFGLLASAQFGY